MLNKLGLAVLRVFVALFGALSLAAMILIFVTLVHLLNKMKEETYPTLYTFPATATLFVFAFAMLLTALWVWRWLKE